MFISRNFAHYNIFFIIVLYLFITSFSFCFINTKNAILSQSAWWKNYDENHFILYINLYLIINYVRPTKKYTQFMPWKIKISSIKLLSNWTVHRILFKLLKIGRTKLFICKRYSDFRNVFIAHQYFWSGGWRVDQKNNIIISIFGWLVLPKIRLVCFKDALLNIWVEQLLILFVAEILNYSLLSCSTCLKL